MSNKQTTEKIISGKFVDFNVTQSKKSNATNLQGEVVKFDIITKGTWMIEEKKADVCMICKLSVKSEQTASCCPMCQSVFHENHIYDWLRVKGKCPVCQQILRPESLERVKI